MVVPDSKVEGARDIGEFHPISLTDCSYKIVSKVLANCLKSIVGEMVDDESQLTFSSERSILDSVVLYEEVIFFLGERHSEGLLVKIDFVKAFDTLGWVFLIETMVNESMKRPNLFWVSAGAPLASVIISTLLVYIFKADNHGISTIGKLKSGLNRPSWDMLLFDSSYLDVVCKTGIMTGIVSLTEGVAVGRTFSALKDYPIDGNKEMMAIGLMNIIGSCTSCYVTTGSFSRSAVNHNAGCKTAMSNIVMSVTVMVTLLFLMPLFVYTPNVVLGAIIISAVVGLVDIHAAYNIWKMDKMDFLVCLCAFLGVIFISVQGGLGLAVGLSIFRILLQISRPKMEIIGNITGTGIYRNLYQYRDARRIPGFLILAVESPINFANTTYLNERITRWIEEEKIVAEKQTAVVILDLSSVSAIDTSGVAFLMDLKKSMPKKGLQLAFVNPVGEVMEKLQRANNVHSFLGAESLYLTIGEAVYALSSLLKESI